MCGIAAFVARESIPDETILTKLLESTERRGTDGFGVVIVNRHKIKVYKTLDLYTSKLADVMEFVNDNLKIGDILIAISRAAPETEPSSSYKNLQPIVNKELGLALVHNGAVSNNIYEEIKNRSDNDYTYISDIDSEAILSAYTFFGKNIKTTCQYLSGGFASIMYDQQQHQLYYWTDHKPLAQAYIRGIGYFLASDNDVLGDIIEDVTGCKRDGICLWEDWYHHYISGHRIKKLDIDSGFITNIKYSPRYVTQNWDSNYSVSRNQELVLVAASGGMDSSLTLAMLKYAGYNNIMACHFRYGHRGQDAELIAITNVCKELDISLKIFDIESTMRSIDASTMLMNKDAPITTGTIAGLKTLHAWTPCRNIQFLTWMMTYAEAEVLKHNYESVSLMGGFLQLTESGTYLDNSEYFISSYINMLRYGSIIGDRIKINYGLSNLMKSDQYYLIKMFKLENMYKYTISCDRPIVKDGVAYNCANDNKPACGSGLLSYWAGKLVGIEEMKIRSYYQIIEDYKAYVPDHMNNDHVSKKIIYNIIDRILFPKDKIVALHDKYMQIRCP